MKNESFDFFIRLLKTISPSGYEKDAAVEWAREARKFADEVGSDQHGNTFACVNKGGSPRVMLAGHIDEIGLMVTYVDDQGFLGFKTIGGWDAEILPGQHVFISTSKGRVVGVLGKKPIHLIKAEERGKASNMDSMWIDIGAKNKKEALKNVSIGDPAVLAYEPRELLNDLVASRGMDDKAGAFVVLEAVRMLSQMKIKAEVYAVATVQEEIGLRGSTTSAYALNPKVGIACDVMFATDSPGLEKRPGEIKMGKGPVITRGPNINPALYDMFVQTAKNKKIPHQVIGDPRGTGTDANSMQLTRSGVASGLISVPNRYMHSPCELVHKKDLWDCARLMAETVAKITDRTEFVIKV